MQQEAPQNPTTQNLKNLSDRELRDLATSLQVLDEKKRYNKLDFFYPETGNLNRSKYKKHLAFFKAGVAYKERAMISANRVGKSFAASYEMALHLTGLYPSCWEGQRFDHPIEAWAVGTTHETTRDILQRYLYGDFYDHGTGMLPKHLIVSTTRKAGNIPDALQDIYVKHFTDGIEDGVSHVAFKSYIQGVASFMGTAIHFIHLDEEPTSYGIYTQCVLRTMTTKGKVIATFTPNLGATDVLLSFLPNLKLPPGGIGEVSDEN